MRSKRDQHEPPNTIRNYRTTFAKLQAHFAGHPERSAAETSPSVEPSKDPAFDAITRDQLIDFFAWMRDEYLSDPNGAAPRGQIKLSPKTILNVHTDLSGLWTWGVEEGFVPANIVRMIDPPDPKAPVVETLTKEEIDALLGACDRGKTWKTRQLTTSDRPTADRDRALILLLDTGLCASGALRSHRRPAHSSTAVTSAAAFSRLAPIRSRRSATRARPQINGESFSRRNTANAASGSSSRRCSWSRNASRSGRSTRNASASRTSVITFPDRRSIGPPARHPASLPAMSRYSCNAGSRFASSSR